VQYIVALILSIAIQYGLPPNFVLAIALTENWTLNPRAVHINVNGTTDLGLMQLNDSWFKEENWHDPVVNITAACKHIAWLATCLEGNTWYAVAIAYNAGINRAFDPPYSSVDYAIAVMTKYQELNGRLPVHPVVMRRGGRYVW